MDFHEKNGAVMKITLSMSAMRFVKIFKSAIKTLSFFSMKDYQIVIFSIANTLRKGS